IHQAAEKSAQVICLPELFRSQYFCQTEDHKNFELAEEVPGGSTSALGEVARETGTAIIASLFEKRSAGVYHNTAAVIDTDGKLLGKYRKMHIPDDPLYHEKFYFAPGDLGFQAWQTTHGKIGVCVCWDQWYPEAARLTALGGAEIIVKGSVHKEEIVIADVEWGRVNEHRTHWPFLRDRRIDAYSGLDRRMID